MKSTRVSICTAVATVVMLCASALPSKAVSYLLSTSADTPMLIGDDANFSAGASGSSPLFVGWLFSLSEATVLAAAGGTNTFGNLSPMTLSIYRDDAGGLNSPDGVGDSLITSASGGPTPGGSTLLNLVAALLPGAYYVSISGPFSGTSGSVSGTLALSAIPLPPAAILFGTALVGLGVLSRRRRKNATA